MQGSHSCDFCTAQSRSHRFLLLNVLQLVFFIFAFGNLTARAILKYICISITKKKELQLSDTVYLPGWRYDCPLSFLPYLALSLSGFLRGMIHLDTVTISSLGLDRVLRACPRYWIRLTSVCLFFYSSARCLNFTFI